MADQVADQMADLPSPGKWQFEIHTDRLLLRAQADQVTDQLEDLPPKENGNLRFILIESYSELRQIKWQINWKTYPPKKMAIWDSYW